MIARPVVAREYALYPTQDDACKLQGRQADQYNRPMLRDRRVAFIGAGNMAEALLAGLLHGGHLPPAHLRCSDISPARRDLLGRTYKVVTSDKNREVAEWADVIVLAVEPQVLDEVLEEVAPAIDASKLVVSVAAGYPIGRIARYLSGTRRLVRAMPNTPSTIREGVTAVAYGTGLTDEDAAVAQALFEPVGNVDRKSVV